MADLKHKPWRNHSNGTAVEGAQAFVELMGYARDLDNAIAGVDGRMGYVEIADTVSRFFAAAIEGESQESKASPEFRRGFFLGMGKLFALMSDGSDAGADWDPLADEYIGPALNAPKSPALARKSKRLALANA